MYTESGSTLSSGNQFQKLSNFDGFWNSVVHETDHFVVIPTLGMLVEGWLLVVPKREILNFGFLTARETKDYEMLTGFLLAFFADSCQELTVFEHGPGYKRTPVGCGVDYAHKHFVPLSFSLLTASKKHDVGIWEDMQDPARQLQDAAHEQSPYLHIHEQGKDFLLRRPSLESQILRKVIAHETAQPNFWDWKENFFEDRIEKTIQAFKTWKAKTR